MDTAKTSNIKLVIALLCAACIFTAFTLPPQSFAAPGKPANVKNIMITNVRSYSGGVVFDVKWSKSSRAKEYLVSWTATSLKGEQRKGVTKKTSYNNNVFNLGRKPHGIITVKICAVNKRGKSTWTSAVGAY